MCFSDYQDELKESVFNKILLGDVSLDCQPSTLVFQTALEVLIALSNSQKASGNDSLLATYFDDKLVYKILMNLTKFDSLTVN